MSGKTNHRSAGAAARPMAAAAVKLAVMDSGVVEAASHMLHGESAKNTKAATDANRGRPERRNAR